MNALKVFGILFSVAVIFMFGFFAGQLSAELDTETHNGWAVRWLKHFLCGAFHGHEWEPTSPLLNNGSKFVRCKHCGKEKMV